MSKLQSYGENCHYFLSCGGCTDPDPSDQRCKYTQKELTPMRLSEPDNVICSFCYRKKVDHPRNSLFSLWVRYPIVLLVKREAPVDEVLR